MSIVPIFMQIKIENKFLFEETKMLDTVKRKSCGLATVGLIVGMTFVAVTPANATNVSGNNSTQVNSVNSSSTSSPVKLLGSSFSKDPAPVLTCSVGTCSVYLSKVSTKRISKMSYQRIIQDAASLPCPKGFDKHCNVISAAIVANVAPVKWKAGQAAPKKQCVRIRFILKPPPVPPTILGYYSDASKFCR